MLANLKIRKKLQVALMPLAFMVIAATLYSSIEMIRIDGWYSELIDRDVRALENLTDARAKATQFGQYLYKEIAEPDLARTQSIDEALSQTVADYHAYAQQAKAESPTLAPQITAAGALFDRAVSDARPIRDAALRDESEAAMRGMRGIEDADLQEARLAFVDLIAKMHGMVDLESANLTARTHRTFLVTWIVILIGLTASFGFAVFVVQKEVADRLDGFRSQILDVAEERLDKSITNLDRTDEIGEMSRALCNLQDAARERATQAWVKATVASVTERLQSAEDFAAFAQILLSHLAESIGLLYGVFYLADSAHQRFTRIGGYAIDPAAAPEFF
ncbi:MAG TPA: hypothetical protein VE178_01275, partial [Silvibacterium sp.]|nr:hypothetical protein [Silvibacterium sp.]